jgi:hypothetical protein
LQLLDALESTLDKQEKLEAAWKRMRQAAVIKGGKE